MAGLPDNEATPKGKRILSPKAGSHRGSQGTPLDIVVSASNLDTVRDGPHGIAVHEFGDSGNDMEECSDIGGHWNPFGFAHGGREDSPYQRHVGDWGNVYVETDEGEADSGVITRARFTDYFASLGAERCGEAFSILGRSIVIHENEDDLGRGGDHQSRIDGNTGDALACCTIVASDGAGFPNFGTE